MKKQLTFLLLSFSMINSYAQITFEKGYFINNEGEKIDCLIKNVDWKNNPDEFKYKLAENLDTQTESIETISKFSIQNGFTFKRFTVKIDRSSEDLNQMSDKKEPKFREEKLFLKVLVAGKATLFGYDDGNLSRYFFQTDTTNVKQLIFKSYLDNGYKIKKNDSYKQQLWKNLKCPSISIKDINKLTYKKNKLVDFFVKYNACTDPTFTNFKPQQKRKLFHLSLRPGLHYSSLSIQNSSPSFISKNADFGSKIGFRLGIEAEFVLPFNKNKWAVMLEPTYQYFQAEEELSIPVVGTQKVQADYKSVELPIGLRHYFFLNDQSKLFINGSVVLDFSFNSIIDYESVSPRSDLDISASPNLTFGLGYNYDKLSMELRYGMNREVLNDYLSWKSEYKSFSVILGYKMF